MLSGILESDLETWMDLLSAWYNAPRGTVRDDLLRATVLQRISTPLQHCGRPPGYPDEQDLVVAVSDSIYVMTAYSVLQQRGDALLRIPNPYCHAPS